MIGSNFRWVSVTKIRDISLKQTNDTWVYNIGAAYRGMN